MLMKSMRGIRLGLGAVAAASVFAAGAALAQNDEKETGRYIVVLKDDAGAPARIAADIVRAAKGRVGHIYGRGARRALRGFSATMPKAARDRIAKDRRVAYIEEDLPVSIFAQETPTGLRRSFAASNPNLDIDGVDDWRVDVDIAILDTGIDLEHPDLNVVGGVDCTLFTGRWPFRRYFCGTGNGGDDDQFHGTHVAGTAAALDNNIGVVGVAPGARLWAVKVLNSRGSGFTSGIIAGLDWVVARGDIEVANLSLGGAGVSAAYQDAIDNAVANGVTIVVAAGNENDDANNYSPAYVPNAITVSALADFDGLANGTGSRTCRIDQDDTLANFSNWGDAVDIAAPGVCILSTFPIEEGEYGVISGTSMAAPHVAGAAALLASGPNAPSNANGVQAIRNTLVNQGNFNWFDDSGDGVQESLLDLGNTSVFDPVLIQTGGTSNEPPVAAFTVDCTDLVCDFTDGSSDGDGSIASRSWSFGDGATSMATNPSHAYAAAGDYTVTLAVADDQGAMASEMQTVSVTDGSSGGDITLSASGRKIRAFVRVSLAWDGAASGNVDVYRNGNDIVTTSNDGAYIDIARAGGASEFTYQVCEAGTNTCSNQSTVSF